MLYVYYGPSVSGGYSWLLFFEPLPVSIANKKILHVILWRLLTFTCVIGTIILIIRKCFLLIISTFESDSCILFHVWCTMNPFTLILYDIIISYNLKAPMILYSQNFLLRTFLYYHLGYLRILVIFFSETKTFSLFFYFL